MKRNYILFVLIFLTTFVAVSQEETPVREYRIKAGFSLGGTMPLSMPAEIREVKSFNPLLNLMLGGEILQGLNENWSLLGGLRFETKGMEIRARVRGYNLVMIADDSEVSGVFTGMVRTNVKNSYLTLPVSAMWQPHRQANWGVKAGLYGSFLLEGDFNGSAYDGYLREGNPTGEKIEITTASYDFSDDLRRWNWGLLLGAEWKPLSNFLVGIDLSWGLNSIFKKDFDVITYKMYPIYGTLSFGYVFF